MLPRLALATALVTSSSRTGLKGPRMEGVSGGWRWPCASVRVCTRAMRGCWAVSPQLLLPWPQWPQVFQVPVIRWPKTPPPLQPDPLHTLERRRSFLLHRVPSASLLGVEIPPGGPLLPQNSDHRPPAQTGGTQANRSLTPSGRRAPRDLLNPASWGWAWEAAAIGRATIPSPTCPTQGTCWAAGAKTQWLRGGLKDTRGSWSPASRAEGQHGRGSG